MGCICISSYKCIQRCFIMCTTKNFRLPIINVTFKYYSTLLLHPIIIPYISITCNYSWCEMKIYNFTQTKIDVLISSHISNSLCDVHFYLWITDCNCQHSTLSNIFERIKILFTMLTLMLCSITASPNATWVSLICKLIGSSNMGIILLLVAISHEEHLFLFLWILLILHLQVALHLFLFFHMEKLAYFLHALKHINSFLLLQILCHYLQHFWNTKQLVS